MTINSHGVNTAGDWYALECTVGGMTEAVTYQWLDWEGSPIISGSSMFIGYTVTYSYIEFFSLHQSHEGNYTCNASTTDATESVSFNVSVNGTCINYLNH